MEKQLNISVLEDKLMEVYVIVEESIRRKGPTEEKKISKVMSSECKRGVWG